jgi:hypothetical protein
MVLLSIGGPKTPFRLHHIHLCCQASCDIAEGSWHEIRLHIVQEFPLEDLAALFVYRSRFTQIK